MKKLANLIAQHIIGGHEERIQRTGSLSPTKSLRHKATRELFGFAWKLDGRWFTAAMVRDALRQLLKEKRFSLPDVPGCSESTWLNDEAQTLQKLLMRAKKSRAAPEPSDLVDSDGAESMNPDEAETLPWPDLDPSEDSPFHLNLCM